MKSRILSCFLIFALCISTLSACGSDTAPSDHSPSSSLQVEISDLQDSTPGETEERDGFESLDSASCKGDTVPSQSDAPSASQGQQTESSAPTEITTASSFSLSDVPAYCMGVASGDSLIKIADEKVSAVHGGDPKDYTVMEMLPLFKATSDFLNREYPGSTFMTAHFDHSIATAIWRLDGQADNLLDTYHREIAAKGLQTEKMVPALRFSTSDVGMSGANLYPIFLVGAESRIVPLGYSIRTEHKNGVDMQYFEEQLRLVYAQFEKALDKQVQLMNIEIRYPVTTLMRVLKRIKAPKKASYEAMDYFVAIHGDSPCTAYELFMQMSDVIFSAQCDGASGLRIAQLEEIVSRALNVNWHEYDHPGDFKW